eukprot:SAG31_NODE_1132_length_9746_cov_6.720639_2_plen_100_part_00
MLKPDERDAAWPAIQKAAAGRTIIAVDYTHPDATISNVEWFVAKGLPFVMGTTGYDMNMATAALGTPPRVPIADPQRGGVRKVKRKRKNSFGIKSQLSF